MNTNRKFRWVAKAARLLTTVTAGSFNGQFVIREVESQPLQRLLIFHAPGRIYKEEEKYVRKLLGSVAKQGWCMLGKVEFDPPEVRALIYLKGRNVPTLYQELG